MSLFSSIKKSLGLEKEQPAADLAHPGNPAAPESPGLDPMFMMNECVNPAMVEILSDVVEDQETDVIRGRIKFDEQMRVSAVENLLRNDAPVMPSPDALTRANELLAPLIQLPANQKFNSIDFTFNGGAIESNINYPD